MIEFESQDLCCEFQRRYFVRYPASAYLSVPVIGIFFVSLVLIANINGQELNGFVIGSKSKVVLCLEKLCIGET